MNGQHSPVQFNGRPDPAQQLAVELQPLLLAGNVQ